MINYPKCFNSLYFIWSSSVKLYFDTCEQQRHNPACACAPSDQCRYYLLAVNYDSIISRTPDRDFYVILPHIPVLARGKDKKRTATHQQQAGRT